ncbi:hypothetical protein A7U60_g7154 [Sanghuangporus baumii]|uniref:Uncharacterized protein n=1 Tax=Sanghuangporus baumii TaxID=108892 RepID=A0A9Q5N0P7_SANBA|nr:hypothetical protein A7U60_g7154 [Sanghuangporus baumii]
MEPRPAHLSSPHLLRTGTSTYFASIAAVGLSSLINLLTLEISSSETRSPALNCPANPSSRLIRASACCLAAAPSLREDRSTLVKAFLVDLATQTAEIDEKEILTYASRRVLSSETFGFVTITAINPPSAISTKLGIPLFAPTTETSQQKGLFDSAGITENGEQRRNAGDDGCEPLTEQQELELEKKNLVIASRHIGMLQTQPMDKQKAVFAELAAKYLPKLVEAFRKRKTPNNAPQTLINYLAFTPYFVRFSQTPAGADLARIQAKRMAHVDLLPAGEHHTVIAELCQLLSTLLIIYCLDFDDEQDREPLLARVKEWRDMYRGRFAEETATRVIDMLEPDTEEGKQMTLMMCLMRMQLGLGVDTCAIKECDNAGRFAIAALLTRNRTGHDTRAAVSQPPSLIYYSDDIC